MDIAISMKMSFWRKPPVLGMLIPIGLPQLMQFGVFMPISKPQLLHLLVSIFLLHPFERGGNEVRVTAADLGGQRGGDVLYVPLRPF